MHVCFSTIHRDEADHLHRAGPFAGDFAEVLANHGLTADYDPLRAEHVVSDDEYRAQRARILDEL